MMKSFKKERNEKDASINFVLLILAAFICYFPFTIYADQMLKGDQAEILESIINTLNSENDIIQHAELRPVLNYDSNFNFLDNGSTLVETRKATGGTFVIKMPISKLEFELTDTDHYKVKNDNDGYFLIFSCLNGDECISEEIHNLIGFTDSSYIFSKNKETLIMLQYLLNKLKALKAKPNNNTFSNQLKIIKSNSLGKYKLLHIQIQPEFKKINFHAYSGTYAFDFGKGDSGFRFGFSQEEIQILKQHVPNGKSYNINAIIINPEYLQIRLVDIPVDVADYVLIAKSLGVDSVVIENVSFNGLHYLFNKTEDGMEFVNEIKKVSPYPSSNIIMMYYSLSNLPSDTQNKILNSIRYEQPNTTYIVSFFYEHPTIFDSWKERIPCVSIDSLNKKIGGDNFAVTASSELYKISQVLLDMRKIYNAAGMKNPTDSQVFSPIKNRDISTLLNENNIFTLSDLP